jgi:hypothetical protein
MPGSDEAVEFEAPYDDAFAHTIDKLAGRSKAG